MAILSKTFHCPDLRLLVQEWQIQQTLHGSPGVENVEVDHVMHTVTVATANPNGIEDLAFLLSTAGFPPEDDD